MRETTRKWGKIEEMFLSCPPGSERLATTALGTNGRQKTCEIFYVYYIFDSGFMCQTTVIFGIRKDGSLVNTLASWNCFTFRNLFQNGANDMSERSTSETAFCKKKAQSCVFFGSSDPGHPILIKFCQLVVNIVIKELQMVFLTIRLSTAMNTWKSLNAKLSVKSWCFDRVFHIAVSNADIKSEMSFVIP